MPLVARRIRKSASRNDVALSTRVTKVDNVSGMRALDLSYSDVFEAAGAVYVRGDKYIRLKDGRGYVLALDGATPLVMRVQPQVSRATPFPLPIRAALRRPPVPALLPHATARPFWFCRWACGCTR